MRDEVRKTQEEERERYDALFQEVNKDIKANKKS